LTNQLQAPIVFQFSPKLTGTGVMGSQQKTNKRYKNNRFFLKDTIRCQIDFRQTDQSQNKPAPPLQKPCPADAERIALPDGRTSLQQTCSMTLANAITRRESVRSFSNAPLSLKELSSVLWAAQGVREMLSPECALRTVPSAGARHSFETYVAASNIEGLQHGLYRYLPLDHELALLYADDDIGSKAAAACLSQRFVAAAAATFFLTAIPARMEWRYDLAAHKVIALDAGHVGQNIYLACTAIGAGACAIAAYDQEAGDELLGIDGEEEFTLYITSIGKR
jgi:SagB-type dehydrogenase family enzyme